MVTWAYRVGFNIEGFGRIVLDVHRSTCRRQNQTADVSERATTLCPMSPLACIQLIDRLTKACLKLQRRLPDCVQPRRYRSWLGSKTRTKTSYWSVRLED
jgi:hypothetical protein